MPERRLQEGTVYAYDQLEYRVLNIVYMYLMTSGDCVCCKLCEAGDAGWEDFDVKGCSGVPGV